MEEKALMATIYSFMDKFKRQDAIEPHEAAFAFGIAMGVFHQIDTLKAEISQLKKDLANTRPEPSTKPANGPGVPNTSQHNSWLVLLTAPLLGHDKM